MKTLSSYKIALLILLAASQSLSFIDRVNLSVVLPELIKEHAYTPSLAGPLMSLLNFFYVGAIVFSGPLTDRVGANRAFPTAVASWSFATALCGLTVQFWPLAALRALVGIGESPNIPSGSQVIQQNFEKTERGFAVSAQFSGNKIGIAVGVPLSSFLLAQFGRPWVFYVTGMLGAIWVLAWLLIYKRPSLEKSAPTMRARSEVRWSSLLKVRSVWGMVLGQAGYLYVYYVFASWLPGYLSLKHNLPIMSTGLLAMLPFLSGIVFTLFGGWASDRLIANGYTISAVRKSFAVGGIFGSTLFIVVVALSQQTWVAVAATTLAVSMLSLSTASANAMPIDVAPPHLVSSCVSIQNFGGNFGGALAPLITGLLISQTGGFMVPLLFTAVVGLVLGCGGFGLIVKNLDHEIGESDVAIDAGFQSSLSPRHFPVCSTGHHQSASTGSANT
jgi:ACS family D-galactonate transporter-like MFS transporter